MKLSGGGSAILVATLVLSACAMKRELPPVEEYGSWTDVVPQQTFIEVRGEQGREPQVLDVNDVLSSADNLRRALDQQFPEVEKVPNLRERIEMIRERYGAGDRRIPTLRGLGGVIADAFLEAALATLDRDGNFDDGKRVYHIVRGRILDYEFNEIRDPDTGAGTGTGSGRLETITYYTRVTVPIGTPNNTGKIISETDAVRWNIKVLDDGFSVRERKYDNPMDPFPNTMTFSAAMVNRVNFLRFEYKLWAQGEIIEIVRVARKNHGETDFTDLDPSEPEYDRIPDNCIDMLFVDNPPPDWQGGLRPPSYCLGRCQNPHLVNTDI